MSNSVFANYMFGIKVEMTPAEEELYLKTLDQIECTDDETEIEAHELTMTILFRSMVQRLSEQYKLSSANCMGIQVIDEGEVMCGSSCTEGCIFGVGVMAFPDVCNDAKNRLDLARLSDHGAEWHSWVS